MRWPKVIGVKLTGTLSDWSSPKDVILEVARQLTVKGGTGAIVEYHGPGADSISATGKGTICNMGAEIGATTSLFGYDHNMAMYLKATGREAIADAADRVADDLRPDDGALYDQLIEIDLDELKPLINGPHSPDRAHRVGADGVGAAARENDWPLVPSAALIGSCTNSSYEDITRAASIARQAAAAGPHREDAAADHAGLRADPRHHRARRPARRPRGDRRDRARQRLRSVHRPVEPPRGDHRRDQHDRQLVQPQLPEAQRRLGQHAGVRHLARHGDGDRARGPARLRPDDRHDHRPRRHRGHARRTGRPGAARRRLRPRAKTRSPPRRTTAARVEVAVSPDSDRLQLLEPFPAWNGEDYIDLPVLVKAQGKFTTDHISMAGPWLKYRGHLENISGNLYLGAVNAFADRRRQLRGRLRQEPAHRRDGRRFPDIAKAYHEAGQPWVVIGDENMGEGSSREHAAMEPRFRLGLVAIARSFARIHETNLKKQGMVPLTFADPATTTRSTRTTASTCSACRRSRARPCAARSSSPTARTIDFEAKHTFSPEQVEWFKAGSALNIIRQRSNQN